MPLPTARIATRRLSTLLMLGIGLGLGLAGCSSTYVTPGGPVAMNAMSQADGDIATAMQRQPAATFPVRLAVARVQAVGYTSSNNQCYGKGAYCVITGKDIEADADLERIRHLSMVSAVAPMNRLLFNETLGGMKDMRVAAATLKCDVLMVYTFDTRFNVDSVDVGPLAVITLGFLPNKKAHVTTTASAIFVDVRSGFVYGVAEASATEEQRASLWSTQSVIEGARVASEVSAFHDMTLNAEKVWAEIAASHKTALAQ